ncbi:hypothetical protein BN3661_00786 [Eubacteriaceae bacterium CHKCI005]|nr:hypothetical protein BN3661_00786 [Eubacteriaceae bacterium CHKCI005]
MILGATKAKKDIRLISDCIKQENNTISNRLFALTGQSDPAALGEGGYHVESICL